MSPPRLLSAALVALSLACPSAVVRAADLSDETLQKTATKRMHWFEDQFVVGLAACVIAARDPDFALWALDRQGFQIAARSTALRATRGKMILSMSLANEGVTCTMQHPRLDAHKAGLAVRSYIADTDMEGAWHITHLGGICWQRNDETTGTVFAATGPGPGGACERDEPVGLRAFAPRP